MIILPGHNRMVFNKTRKTKASKKNALRRATNAVSGVGKKVRKTVRNIGKKVRNAVTGIFHKKRKSRRRSQRAVPPPVEQTPVEHEPVKPIETPEAAVATPAVPKATPPVPTPVENGAIPKVPSGTPAGGSF